MANKMRGMSVFLVILGITCFLGEQVTAKPMETCVQELAKVYENLAQAVKNGRRDSFRRDCETYRKLVDECTSEHISLIASKVSYELSCTSAEAQKWLKSSASAMQGSFLAAILATVTIMLRL